jgi:hypothetical protein
MTHQHSAFHIAHPHQSNLDQRHAASLHSLSPLFRSRVELLLKSLSIRGWHPIVFSGCRSEREQQVLVERGVGGTKSWHVAGRHEDRYRNGSPLCLVPERFTEAPAWRDSACSCGEPVDDTGHSSECALLIGPFCLRVSGAVAPSAPRWPHASPASQQVGKCLPWGRGGALSRCDR